MKALSVAQFIVGWGVGASVGWWLGLPLPSAPREARATGGQVELSGGSLDPVDEVIAGRDEEIRALSAAAFGIPLSWPAPADEGRAEAELGELLADCDDSVVFTDVNCHEPPCIVAAAVREGATLASACPGWASLPVRASSGGGLACADTDLLYAVYAVGARPAYAAAQRPEALGTNEGVRDRVRMEEARDALPCGAEP